MMHGYKIDTDIAQSVLTIGEPCDTPTGGISQVLCSYRANVFPVFKHIANFKGGSAVHKLATAVSAYLKTYKRLRSDKKIRIVHIHTASDYGFVRSKYFVNLAHAMGRKVILHIHSGRFNDYYLQNKADVEKVFAKCSRIVALTPKIKDFYNKMGCEKVEVINNIIEYPDLQSAEATDSVIHMLFLGELTKKKGIFDLVDVLGMHADRFRGRVVLHIGGVGENKKLLSLIDRYGISDFVKYEGWVDSDKKKQLLNKCQIFILPSYTEGLPISILEAKSYGLFIIATKVGGIPEIVNDSTGALFRPGDNDAMLRILDDMLVAGADAIDKDAIRKSAEPFTPPVVAAQLEQLYMDVLNE